MTAAAMRNHWNGLAIALRRQPPALWGALLPWWGSLVLAGQVLADGRLLPALGWAVGGLLYSAAVATAVLLHLAAEPS